MCIIHFNRINSHSKKMTKQKEEDKKEEEWKEEREREMECRLAGRALDQHANGTGSIPQCSNGFFSQSQLSVSMQTLLQL